MSKTRYQQGSIRRVKRRRGPDVWVFRWRSTHKDGSRKENNRVIGTVLEYRTKAAAEKAAEALRININSTTPRPSVLGMTFGDLAEHYIARELDSDQSQSPSPKAHSTVEANRRYLRKWVLPRWGRTPISEIEPVEVEDWLAELGRGQDKLANGTRLKIRNLMSVVFRHGSRHGFVPRDKHANPIKYVRQSGGPAPEHTRLTPDQAMAIIGHLHEPVRTMAFLDASTGLRASELTGLRWRDVDFNAGILTVRRGVVDGVVGEVKTDASRSQLPLAPLLLDLLAAWRRETPYARPGDWIFASPRTRGKKPFRANSLLRRQMRLAAATAGILGPVGWHTFRRSISTWMIANDENVKVTQELLRHANSRTTLDLYAKAVTPSKRFAHERIVDDLVAAQQRIMGAEDPSSGATEVTVG
ncbi:MAG: tyrosine-type recombinase/integrase [Acidobacteriaceae bacterium]|nr:tyrosine-type recombinase/integrase [Acidobacteriaceae bacterium]